MNILFGNCVGSCDQMPGPPPDFILSMPPPPLPSFLISKPKHVETLLPSNESQPCFAAFMCGQNHQHNESGNALMELVRSDTKSLENIWFFVSSCIGIFVLGCFLALIVIRCKDSFFSYHDANIKQTAINALGDATKSNAFTSGGILYPCATANSRDLLQSQLVNDSRLLWATLTPHGTRHFVIENSQDGGHYESVDYRGKAHNQVFRGYAKHSQSFVKSFDNNGFVDYDYEDPTPLMESYHDDMDSGYQEPHEITGSLKRSPMRTLGTSPIGHEAAASHSNCGPSVNPNSQAINTLSISRKTTLSRRISDASSHNGTSM
ncbi:uncharacterized protein Dwil_GK10065 [Drosophila willistoni]|uniref:CG9919-PA n=1 Tax=Drosophila willistoni TaxID=7260 RepID=B4NCM0_DROWI|nr:uncharacterized protein LOC6648780 [Drosophila willistoni]XP_046867295.1 uncharacterized protein LOC6648780 [Drosophila willistoni]EDW82579.1 uncharacterized protein Dwil_GK10065 [Drosophila willistoni]